MWIDPCGTLNQQAVCNAAQGLPTSPFTQIGTATPEGSATGYAVGLHQFWDETNAKMYIFNGTVGENTGWVALN